VSVDLHTHTTYSDGTFTPSDLVNLAKLKSLTAIAITDHDITSGNREALSRGKEIGIEVVPGVELSVDYPLPQKGHLHLLGLFIDPDNNALKKSLQIIRQARTKRNYKILKRLTELGKEVTKNELTNEAGDGSVGRPHIATIMVKKGYVKTIKEAFQHYLKNGAPAYFDRLRIPVTQAIDLIHVAGGIAILAHPSSLGFSSFEQMGIYIMQLKEIGLDGIEVWCPGQDEQMMHKMLTFARANLMVVSGGSDFHGNAKPEQQLGSVDVPDQVYIDLVKYYESKNF
jgi:predicted metal-dependent phosphoesterase TrpH